MKAAVIVAFGATDQIEVADVPRPKLQPDDILDKLTIAQYFLIWPIDL